MKRFSVDAASEARPAFVLTDCHERVGELVLLFGRGQLVFEGELLQWFAPLQ